MYYAGIGSRETPEDIQAVFSNIAFNLERKGLILRSGGAEGADSAFQEGVEDKRNMQVFIPWNGFNGLHNKQTGIILPEFTDRLMNIASHFHPAWDRLGRGARKLHARNVHQMIGPDLDDEENVSKFVVCWTKNGAGKGGTGQALRIAEHLNVPVFDLGHENSPWITQQLVDFVDSL